MISTDRQILFTALGFLAVILQETPKQKQAVRAISIAKLIEEFCQTAMPEITKATNSMDGLLLDAMKALETCLEESPLTFSSEQNVEAVINRIKKMK